MTIPRTLLAAALVAALVQAAASASAALAADSCPNAGLRTGPSAGLPDCRAYELVSTDSNHAQVNSNPRGVATDDGNTMAYTTLDAPENASAGQANINPIVARRDQANGWSGTSLAPPLSGPATGFQSLATIGISPDLSTTIVSSTQPLDGQPRAGKGYQDYVGHPGGRYRAITAIPNADGVVSDIFAAGNADFSRVYFQARAPQRPADSTVVNNTYAWTADSGLELVGILPDGTLAPNGALLIGSIIGATSEDAKRAAFVADGRLYLHVEGAPSIEVSASQRTVAPDPNVGPGLVTAGITKTGSTVLFVAHTELTNDAYTGRSGGVATDAGADLYSYDVESGRLTDLTVDKSASDVATGANVQRVQANADGSYVYFTANGNLAEGATAGETSLYVWHDNTIEFVAPVDTVPDYVTPDGRHALITSTKSLTGYDNTDPVTAQPHSEVFLASAGAGLECVSCRSDGTRPTGESYVPHGDATWRTATRTVSDDGGRVFFESTDTVIPRASGGLQKVFEYTNGRVQSISPLGSSSHSSLLVVSPSGDDVFFSTSENLVPNPKSGPSAVIDARVGGGFAAPVLSCARTACLGSATLTPELPNAASLFVLGSGNANQVDADRVRKPKVRVSRAKTVKSTVATVQVTVSGKGTVTILGSGIQSKAVRSLTAQTLAIRIVLTTKARAALRRNRSFKTEAKVTFTDSRSNRSSAAVALSFKLASSRKGR